jgi:UDP-glucose 4-epimerase
MSHVLVTGANGFVGQRLCATLALRGFAVRAAVRSAVIASGSAVEYCNVGGLGPDTDWTQALEGVDAVVHLAAKAHVLDQPHDDGEYHRINAEGTRRLASAAQSMGVRRFVYLSSIKVYGEGRPQPFTAEETPQPSDVYGRSKLAGEHFVRDVARAGAMEFAIVRPPLVYGPEVRANFLRLLQWVDRELPLPLGAVRNARSLVALDNLCDLMALVLESPRAANGTWLVSDGEDVSTPELIRRMARAMRRGVRLISVPPVLLRAAGALVGRGGDVSRLCGSLTLDIGATRADLGWNPPVTPQVAIAEVVKWYLESRKMRMTSEV